MERADDTMVNAAENVAPVVTDGVHVRPVAIAGMHRSGTSMVARLLQLAGLHLGDSSDLMPPAAENPEGFYEHLELVKLNDEVLDAAGAGWDCPPAPEFDWSGTALAPFRERARAVAAPLRERPPWGWKDPRTSLTLPFWRSVFGPLRTVIVVRNPLEVVTSLHRRNAFSTALGLTLWQIYAERVLADTSPDERLITHFDSYFLDPDREIARVLEYLGLDRDQDRQALRSGAVPELRHHRKTVHDLVEHGIPADVIELYLRLCREAGWVEGDADMAEVLQASRSSATGDRATIVRGIGHTDLIQIENDILKRIYADRDARIAELELALQNHETLRAELDGKIAERDSRLIERNLLIARRDHALCSQREQLADAEAELQRLRGEVASLTERVAASERERQVAELREHELRSMVTDLQAVQLHRDSEIMSTLGAALSRVAPNAPASIYYRRLVGQVRSFVESHVPAGARLLVVTYGDEAMLRLGERVTESFPRSAHGVSADYTDVREDEAIAQLESLRAGGAEFLLVPSHALAWLATHDRLERHLQERYSVVARERGIGTIYALAPRQGRVPA